MSYPSARPSKPGLPARGQSSQAGKLDDFDRRQIDLYSPVFRIILPAVQEAAASGPFSFEMLMALAWEQSGMESDDLSPEGGEGLYSMTSAQVQAVAPELAGTEPDLCDPAVAAHLARRYLTMLLDGYADVNLALVAFRFGNTFVDETEAAGFLRHFYSTLAYLTRTRPWDRPLSKYASGIHAYKILADPNFLKQTYAE